MATVDRYASVTGAGAHDGSSPSNAWTIVEAADGATGVSPGQKLNILSGTYTLAANIVFPAGTNENPILYRGYASAINDLQNFGRDLATGPLTTTFFPVIDDADTYTITFGAMSNIENITLVTSRDDNMLIVDTGCVFRRCFFDNDHATGAAIQLFDVATSHEAKAIDCDIRVNTTGACIIVDSQINGTKIIGCRIWNANESPSSTSRGVQLGGGAVVSYCVVFNVGRAFQISRGALLSYNTVYDCVTGVYLSSTTLSAAVINNIFYSMSGYMIDGNHGSASYIQNNAGGALTSGRINTSALGTVITEEDAIVLTADPFTDAASKDFTLNNIAGGGALCRAVSQLWAGESDIGAVQHADAGGGGGGCIISG